MSQIESLQSEMEQKQSCVVGQISILLQSVQYRYVLDIPEERVSAE